jgi:hypothetical protein
MDTKKRPHPLLRMVLLLCLACLISPTLKAQSQATNTQTDIAKRVEELQNQVDELRAELAKVKEQGAAPAPPATATSAPAATAPTAQASTPAAVAPPASGQPAPAGNAVTSLLANTNVTGFVDTYYGYDFNQPHNRTTNFRAFDGPNNQFGLNLIELTFDKAPDANGSRLGYHLALGYGNAINVINSASPSDVGFAQYLKEAYGSYLLPVGKGLQVDFGKFVTPFGEEVIESKDDFNYSRGLLFTYAIPFYHFGLRAKYAFNDKFSVMGHLVNGWNNIIGINTGKTGGIGFTWTPTKKVTITENYMVGPAMPNTNSHPRQLTETLLTISPTSKLSFVVDYNYGRGDIPAGFVDPVYWTGIAGYIHYAFNDSLAWTTRYEYYNDHDGFTTGTLPRTHMNEVTETIEKRIHKNLITRLEYRYDNSNHPVYMKGDSWVTGQHTVAAGLIYVFDWREP